MSSPPSPSSPTPSSAPASPRSPDDTSSAAVFPNDKIAAAASAPVHSAISSPLSSIQQHFDLQSAQLRLAEQTLKTHFNSELPTHLNPVGLLARLRAIQAELPQLIERQQRIAREKQAALEEVNRLTQANKELLSNISNQVSQSEEQLNYIAATSSSSSSTLPHLSIPSTSPTRSAKKKSRPSTAPLSTSMTPSKESAILKEEVVAGKTRRKSMRSAAPPSPSTLQEAALLDAISVSSELEGPITEKEFAGVSTTVKSRVKLADVNAMLTTIQQHFQRYIQHHKVKDVTQLPPLTLTALATDGAGTVKVGGASAQCIIGTLRACKRIIVGKQGITLVKPPTLGRV